MSIKKKREHHCAFVEWTTALWFRDKYSSKFLWLGPPFHFSEHWTWNKNLISVSKGALLWVFLKDCTTAWLVSNNDIFKINSRWTLLLWSGGEFLVWWLFTYKTLNMFCQNKNNVICIVSRAMLIGVILELVLRVVWNYIEVKTLNDEFARVLQKKSNSINYLILLRLRQKLALQKSNIMRIYNPMRSRRFVTLFFCSL